ncbi:MAG TPA: type III-B CRISPR module-associated protein Cmr3 [bacterium]|nr:type III-B CRISPR module-associated protein Cmr3 [bacterium]
MTEKTFIHIKPHDPLFFRGGKPFDLGEETWAESSLLPNPSVIWGAIFSKMIADNGGDFVSIDEKDFPSLLTINNIYIYNKKENRFLLPAPLDLFVDEDGKIHGERFEKKEICSSGNPFMILPDTEKPCKRLENCFMEVSSFGQMYFKNYADNLVIYSFDEVMQPDSKIGIKRSKNTRTTEEGCLYRIDTTQFKENWGFLVEVVMREDLKFVKEKSNEKGLLKLGGDGKTVEYQIVTKECPLEKVEKYYKSKSCETWKLILTTPSVFEEGWKPKIQGVQASSVGKPFSIGGFDMKKRMPKPMVKAVPAGSVYVFDNNNKQDFDASGIITSTEQYKGFNRGIIIPLYDGEK